MENKLNIIKRKLRECNDLVFLIVSVLFGIIMSFAKMGEMMRL